jgi:Zn-dependent M28 family amino/carboxypeptidase
VVQTLIQVAPTSLRVSLSALYVLTDDFPYTTPNDLGTAVLLEVARGLGELLTQGWQPRRTIIFGSWDGEEYALLGSTRWAGDNEGLLAHAVAYINVDTAVSGTYFDAKASPALARVLEAATRIVDLPNTTTPLSTVWGIDRLGVLGSGSDYTAFIHHLGVPSMDMNFGPKSGTYGVYHSIYDSFTWMDTFGDPGFV